jgi:iron complex outermembrane receptor protein
MTLPPSLKSQRLNDERRRHCSAAIVCLSALGSLLPAQAQQPVPQAQTLERVTITGSNIRRTDQESVAPVEIITREQIERSGLPTIADVIRTIPANLGGSISESFTNGFASGASGISLRGLGQKTTLVLLNGRRVTGYGFAQNLQETFVDFNSIPTSAIERVEILKDGASAIYGSDAIAGVINIILRRDYKGIEAGGSVGFFEGANDYRANVVGGFGDLGTDKFNVFGVFDYYKRDHLLFSDTKHQEDRDYRGEDGGRNFWSLVGGGTWRELTPTGAAANNLRAISGCNGTVLTAAQAVERGLISPVLGNAGFDQPGNTFCAKDFNYAFTALPETERFGFLGGGTIDFSSSTQAFVEAAYSRVKTFQTFGEPFFSGTTGLQQTPSGLRPFTYNINFGSGVSGNPFSGNARYLGNLNDMGTRDTDISSDTYRFLAGLRYSAWGWVFESAVGWSKNEVEQMSLNRLSKSGTSAVFGVPATPQPPVPSSTDTDYNLDNPASNSQAVRDQMRINFPRVAESTLAFIDTKATTEIGRMPGGPVGLAVGAEFRKEQLTDTPDTRAAAGDILGQGITATDGDRDNLAVYAELALPVTRQLEAQLALRYDHYSDFGSAVTPKIGAKFTATPELLFRANWGRGFRAPTLPEISPSVATFFAGVIDPLTSQLTSVSGVFAGNPTLNPEKSRNTTIGLVWEPNTSFNIALDWYQITWSNIVASPSFQSIVNTGDPNKVIRDPVTGRIVTVLSNYENLKGVETSGVDVDARHVARTTWGRFTTRLNATYVDTFEEEGVECVGTNGCTNTYPRWKGFLSLDWDRGPWAATARVNYIHSYYHRFLSASFFLPQDPRFQTGTYPERVPSYTTLDVFARYNFTTMLQVFGSIINVTDEMPPYDPAFNPYFYDFTQYDIRGRQYRIGVSYKFK